MDNTVGASNKHIECASLRINVFIFKQVNDTLPLPLSSKSVVHFIRFVDLSKKKKHVIKMGVKDSGCVLK